MELIAFIRSGGQTGADRGALDAARAAGVPICGWCPRGGTAEDYRTPPGLLADYPELAETPAADYIQRTDWNVRDAHATLVVTPGGLEPDSGTAMTVDFARNYGRPYLVLDHIDEAELDRLVCWLSSLGTGLTLNVAGPRGSKRPDVYAMTMEIVGHLLQD